VGKTFAGYWDLSGELVQISRCCCVFLKGGCWFLFYSVVEYRVELHAAVANEEPVDNYEIHPGRLDILQRFAAEFVSIPRFRFNERLVTGNDYTCSN
jgi:hypothetical protein